MSRRPDVTDDELEARILRALERHPSMSKSQLHQLVGGAAKRFRAALVRLESRNAIECVGRSRYGHALVALRKESRSTEIQSTSTLIDQGSGECVESNEMHLIEVNIDTAAFELAANLRKQGASDFVVTYAVREFRRLLDNTRRHMELAVDVCRSIALPLDVAEKVVQSVRGLPPEISDAEFTVVLGEALVKHAGVTEFGLSAGETDW